jgi:hypothetical protein
MIWVEHVYAALFMDKNQIYRKLNFVDDYPLVLAYHDRIFTCGFSMPYGVLDLSGRPSKFKFFLELSENPTIQTEMNLNLEGHPDRITTPHNVLKPQVNVGYMLSLYITNWLVREGKDGNA